MTETAYVPFSSLDVTNQCVVVCDLAARNSPESTAWRVIKGTQDEVGRSLATMLDDRGVQRIDDFGGVCKTFLCDGDDYRETPPRIAGRAAVFSFTPRKRIAVEGLEMARVSSAAGYAILILTVQKHDKFGKVWVLCGILRHLKADSLTYYEDTNSVIDELKDLADSEKVFAVHVQVPGFENYVARRADRVVSQIQYPQEVLKRDEAT